MAEAICPTEASSQPFTIDFVWQSPRYKVWSLGLDKSLDLGGEKGRRHVVDILGRTASAAFAATA
ncbi:hypothetical protein N7537_002197 [Penicillium hordei]|uniref:Uncharacterized protein n=1 Tax=Penicillium hordei TaxID=40994 RepID=A0AAD6H7M0_9EURO|nr:uncharacterized protein N7537_002197 [Penicillium hordei]KAJ5617083.1 hypothetical protein N7537_002197 [Penicillium hordei]